MHDMTRSARTVFTSALLVLASATSAHAQAQAPDAAPKPRTFEGTAVLGFSQTRGNANAIATNVANKLKYTMKGWAVLQDLAFFYGEADDKVNANFWNGGFRGERRLTPRFGTYVITRFDRNVLQGIATRFEEGLGMDYKILDAPRNKLNVALGASAFQQTLTPGSTSSFKGNFPAARTALDYKHLFSDVAFVQQTAEYLPILRESNGYLLNTETSIVAPFTKSLALKTGYVVRYNAEPPVRNNKQLKNTDTFFSTGLTYSF
jgi:putative salt-induced outer membrane protein